MPESITITIVQRLAYLIARLETSERYSNALGSKWYLQHLTEVFLPGSLQEIIEPFVARLQQDVQSYERRYGVVDTDKFDRMIEFAGVTRQHILYGETSPWAGMGPAQGSPRAELDSFISTWMWRQSLFD